MASESGNSSAPNKYHKEIPAKDLGIIWIEDSRYWKKPENKDSPAELLQVCWLEITGSDETDLSKKYRVGFSVELNPDAFGWGKYPIYVMVKKGKNGKMTWTKARIDPNKEGRFEITGKSDTEVVKKPDDDDKRLYFGLYEVWSGKWKGGLKVYNAFIDEI